MINAKRAAGLALIAFISAASVMPVQAFWPLKWTIGYEKNTNGPEKGVQGANGWYFMYSEAVNTGGKIDTSGVKECIWTDTGSCRMWYDYDKMWMPDIYAAEDYDCLAAECWWRMDENGIMDPNVKVGAVSSVIAWEAPEAGTYSINASYTAGSMLFDWTGKDYDEGDGLTLFLCTDTEVVDQAFCGVMPETEEKVIDHMPAGSFNGKVRLKKGEKIYMIADPGTNGGADIATVKMEIIQEEGAGIRTFWRTVMIAGIAAVFICIALIVGLLMSRKKVLREPEEEDREDYE